MRYYTEIESHLEHLSALGTGLLLGVALGVIIPEYVQARVLGLYAVVHALSMELTEE